MGTLTVESQGRSGLLVWMNDPTDRVNTLKRELLDEFESVLAEIERRHDVETVVFASSKPDCFIAGADLDMLARVRSEAEAAALSQTLQALHDRVQHLAPVTVAAIHGPCLGGGLELALAFDKRVASDDDATRLGLPEVQLGLLPGGGGTQRLPRLVGLDRALDLMLTGRRLGSSAALRAGLVDEVVAKETLIEAALSQAARGGADGLAPRGRSPWKKARRWVLSGNPLGRRVVLNRARVKTVEKTHGNYPAPETILEVVRIGLEQGTHRGLQAEARAFGELAMTPHAKNLIGLFFAANELKKEAVVDRRPMPSRPVSKIGILGAGLMGAGIAYVSAARAGVRVRMKDKDHAGVSSGLRHVHQQLERRLRRGAINRLDMEHVMAKVSGTIDYTGLANCDVVVEAVFEDVELKRRMVREVEALGDDSPIFASNTSAIPIAEIAAGSRSPDKVVGMHYFSPVEKMPLLEVVIADATADWVAATCVALGKRQGKTVIVVTDGPGFYTTRVLAPYMSEAAQLLNEGVAADRIDDALTRFGFAVGPMALLDDVGIDVGHKVSQSLHSAFGERMQPAPNMARLVEDGRLGRKNGRGIYVYGKKSRGRTVDRTVYDVLGVSPGRDMAPDQIVERCTLRMVNEAAHCLGEGILRCARDGDVGAVLGLGFPPFLGGPFRYLDDQGIERVRDRLRRLADANGGRFAPAPVICELKKFYN